MMSKKKKMAKILLGQLNTAGGIYLIKNEVDSFLKNSTIKFEQNGNERS